MIARCIVTGWLQTRTTTAIGTGNGEKTGRAPAGSVGSNAKQAGDGRDGDILEIALDHYCRPYIPGSSLKGVLRAWLALRLGDRAEVAEVIEGLFGGLPHSRGRTTASGDPIDTPLGGKIEVLDAFLAEGAESRFPWIGQTAIDPETRTASSGMLRHQRVVEPGTNFGVEIVANDLSPEEIGILLFALEAFNEPSGPRVGGDTGQGMGRMKWSRDDLKVVDTAAISAWLKSGAETPWIEIARSIDATELCEEIERARETWASEAVSRPELILDLEIAFTSPFLVADPSRYEGSGKPDAQPRLRNWRKGDSKDAVPLLPGTSVKGALRAQAARIARTVAGTEGADDPPVIERIFGSTEQAGLLKIDDFCPPDDSRPVVAVQEFVAVDRFTGGAAGRQKFQVEAVQGESVTNRDSTPSDGQDGERNPISDMRFLGAMRLSLDPRMLDEADRYRLARATGKKIGDLKSAIPPAIGLEEIGLLSLLFRDLIDGDIAFGAGAAKGYGACQVRIVAARTTAPDRLMDLLGIEPTGRADWQAYNDAGLENADRARLRALLLRAVSAFHAETAPRTHEAENG